MPKPDITEKIGCASQPMVFLGDIAAQDVDAIVVPHFYNQDKFGWPTVSRQNPIQNVETFAAPHQHADNRFGNILLTRSKITKSKYLLNIIPRESSVEEKPVIAYDAVCRAIEMATNGKMGSIAFPVLGMGIMAGLSPKQCAVVLGTAIYNSRPMNDIRLVVPGNNSVSDEIARDINDVIKSVRLPEIASEIGAALPAQRTQILASLLNTFARMCY